MREALFARHAFVDLETTGLDPARDDVIEVGALFVENGEPVKRISRLFKPSAPLPLAIRRITGITDQALAECSSFSTFLPVLQDALRGWTVVAHNASFERSFLSGLLTEIRAPVLDSCELLHYLYPELESHSLEAVVRWAGVSDKAAHRALKDCEDTFGVLSFALAQCRTEGRGDDLQDVLACLGADAGDPLVEILEGLRRECRAAPPPLALTPSTPFLPGRAGRERASPPAPGGDHPAVAVPAAELDAVLGPQGSLEATAVGFESRPEQRALAHRVALALERGEAVGVEAGTGTGKSLGYLVPAALFAAKNGWKVAVATHTRTLQDQLIDKDLPRLHRATNGQFEYALLKGQNNYLCRRRTLELTRVSPGMDRAARSSRAYLRAFLRRSPDGDLDRLSYWFKEHYPGVVPLAAQCRSEAATTLAERCPHFHRCFYHSAVAQARSADVLVINQALAAAWPQRYPVIRHTIVDEAHALEDVLTDALSAELSAKTLHALSERLAARIPQALGETPAELGQAVVALCEAHETMDLFDGRSGPAAEARITDETLAGPRWPALERTLTALGARLDALILELSELDPGPNEREVSGSLAALREASALVRGFAQGPQRGVCTFARVRSEDDWALVSQPLEVGQAFHEAFVAPARALVLTSATLSVGAGAPWVLDRLGLRAETYRTATPFDLEHQGLVMLVSDAPDPREEEFLEWCTDRVSGLAEFLGGRVLALFASSRRRDQVGERVRARLEPKGIEVLRQSASSGRALVAHQARDLGTVLLGTKAFWQGVDIPGRGVACVFIDKLPLEPLSRPLVAAREEALGGGPAAFARYRLPRALLQLRQGVGRLIRSFDDRGVVIIADPGSNTYRSEVLAALEGYRVEALPWHEARVRIHETLLQMGLRSLGFSSPAGAAASRPPSP